MVAKAGGGPGSGAVMRRMMQLKQKVKASGENAGYVSYTYIFTCFRYLHVAALCFQQDVHHVVVAVMLWRQVLTCV
jgi:hypothetical protein